VAVVLPAILGLSGCGSFPKPKDPQSTLLVIVRGWEKPPEFHESLYGIEIVIAGIKKPIIVKPSNSPLYIDWLEPGDYQTASLRYVDVMTQGGWDTGGSGQAGEAEIPFKMEAGTITVFPLEFVQVVENTSRGVSIDYRIVALDDGAQERFLEELSAKKQFAAWKNQHGVR
jgi:hypothetical protein